MENGVFGIDFTSLDAEVEGAIKRGLEKGEANMVKVYAELREKQSVADMLKDLTISIVPYTIKDTSLRKIVLEAPDYIIDEINDALKERRRLAEFGGFAAEAEEGDSAD